MALSDDLDLVALEFRQIAYCMCPKDKLLLCSTIRQERTHTLGMNAINVYVGSDKAFYMPFTNEKWVSPRWHGAKNPNEAWWDKSIAQVCNLINDEERGVMVI